MNYYEHHLGDYMRDTAHLSVLEDGTYRRLIDAYYVREEPLPKNNREIYRLIRAQSKSEREACDIVLKEFFIETPEGWRHKRCDEEIARYQTKRRKAKESANARWNNANASETDMRSHCEGNAPTHQTPDTSHHNELTHSKETNTSNAVTDIDRVCLEFEKYGITKINKAHPMLKLLIEAGASQEEFCHAAAVAAGKSKFDFVYVLGIVKKQREDAANAHLVKGSIKRDNWRKNDESILGKARELGIGTAGLDRFQLIAKIEARLP